MKRKLWDIFWKVPHNIRTLPCKLFDKHLGKSWFGIKTIEENGDGYCSICGTGNYHKPYFK